MKITPGTMNNLIYFKKHFKYQKFLTNYIIKFKQIRLPSLINGAQPLLAQEKFCQHQVLQSTTQADDQTRAYPVKNHTGQP